MVVVGNDEALVLAEPHVEFRYGQAMTDPHDGLSMFGPHDADMASHPKNISYGLIGNPSGIEEFGCWARQMRSAIHPQEGENRRLWPTFPGFEAAFVSTWPTEPTRTVALDEEKLVDASREKDANKRAYAVVEQYLGGIERLHKRDEPFGVIICVVPDIVHVNCRPQSRVLDGIGYAFPKRIRSERARGQADLFDHYDPSLYQYSVDFRRQTKARSMKYNIPIQIIRQSTLRLRPAVGRSERELTPLSDRAWNLGVALYYKAGGKPWRLSSARKGVCYIGIAYRRSGHSSTSRSACCAAQMFLDSGDGIVFLGEYGPWYSPLGRDFHLTRAAAKRLLEGVLRTYEELEGRELSEIFLHCRSTIDDEEFAGFEDACPRGVRIVGIRVRQERFDARLFREGSYPVLRGTFWRVHPRKGYLWASGFKPRLATYDGWEVPVPLRIQIQHGEADLRQVATDILGLTKLNYNACRLGDAEPVTIGFSDAVGEILVSNPTVQERSPKFKFYI
ncbi:MAG: hypothetical protein A2Y61_06185 [Chloroflexi bacterium RBG_13_60_13]|nr:MAG: hypothetical protein A2Y61_06185 [Chloroflexi bacterium RBG_13_60_13]